MHYFQFSFSAMPRENAADSFTSLAGQQAATTRWRAPLLIYMTRRASYNAANIADDFDSVRPILGDGSQRESRRGFASPPCC